MKKVALAASIACLLTIGAVAPTASFAASKKQIQVDVTGKATASVTHSFVGKIKLAKAISGVSCAVLLDGNIKTSTISLNSAGKGSFTIASSVFKKQYTLGKTLAVLTVNCSNRTYVGTSVPHLLTFVR